eukprot:TRINITY_DN7290_c0_g1_i4.p1 TRINITY_DN7290_c0_g1~~TRINITY_DN7290_c0_g1_i4.p1  ORF type:complete len:1286 (+),score=228.71 TRINITY_DN7290_c0_g1_i4:63-3920(+)
MGDRDAAHKDASPQCAPPTPIAADNTPIPLPMRASERIGRPIAPLSTYAPGTHVRTTTAKRPPPPIPNIAPFTHSHSHPHLHTPSSPAKASTPTSPRHNQPFAYALMTSSSSPLLSTSSPTSASTSTSASASASVPESTSASASEPTPTPISPRANQSFAALFALSGSSNTPLASSNSEATATVTAATTSTANPTSNQKSQAPTTPNSTFKSMAALLSEILSNSAPQNRSTVLFTTGATSSKPVTVPSASNEKSASSTSPNQPNPLARSYDNSASLLDGPTPPPRHTRNFSSGSNSSLSELITAPLPTHSQMTGPASTSTTPLISGPMRGKGSFTDSQLSSSSSYVLNVRSSPSTSISSDSNSWHDDQSNASDESSQDRKRSPSMYELDEKAEESKIQLCRQGSVYFYLESEQLQNDYVQAWLALPAASAQMFAVASSQGSQLKLVNAAVTVSQSIKSIIKYAKIAVGNCPIESTRTRIQAYLESAQERYEFLLTCTSNFQQKGGDQMTRHQLVTAAKTFLEVVQQLISSGGDQIGRDSKELEQQGVILDPLADVTRTLLEELNSIPDLKSFQQIWPNLTRKNGAYISAIHQRASSSKQPQLRKILYDATKEISDTHTEILNTANQSTGDMMFSRRFQGLRLQLIGIQTKVSAVSTIITLMQIAEKSIAYVTRRIKSQAGSLSRQVDKFDQALQSSVKMWATALEELASELGSLGEVFTSPSRLHDIGVIAWSKGSLFIEKILSEVEVMNALFEQPAMRLLFLRISYGLYDATHFFMLACRTASTSSSAGYCVFLQLSALAWSIHNTISEFSDLLLMSRSMKNSRRQRSSDAALGTTVSDALEKSPLSKNADALEPVYDDPTNIWVELEAEKQDTIIWMEVEGSKRIRAASVNCLIERVTSGQFDLDFVKAFLATYRSFISPESLLDKLFERYQVPERFSDQANVIKLRVCNFLHLWLRAGSDDIDSHLLSRVERFAQEAKSLEGSGGHIALKLTIAIQQLRNQQAEPLPTRPSLDQMAQASPEIWTSKVLDADVDVLANQLTLIDFSLFCRIKCHELLDQSWNRRHLRHHSPHVVSMIARFNYISSWVVTSILWQEQAKKRAKVITKFIQIAEALRKLNNFNSLMGILSGLNQTPIHRLRIAMEEVSPRAKQTLAEIHELMSSASSYRKYRETLHNAKPPCIPFLGVYLSDLTFIEDGNKDSIDGLVNFRKRELLFNVIREISSYQQEGYQLKQEPILYHLMIHPPSNPDHIWYDLSLIREPKGTERLEVNAAENLIRKILDEC